jgi:hypothetical protein
MGERKMPFNLLKLESFLRGERKYYILASKPRYFSKNIRFLQY